MAQEKIDLKKKGYNKVVYPTIINTRFNELGVISVNSQIEATPTVEDFFDLYNQLFYEIPAFGNTNSHQYLIQTSAEYIDYQANQEEIEALRLEITQLRRDLLESQIAQAELASGESLNIDLDSFDQAAFEDSGQFADILNNIGDVPSSNGTTAQSVVSNTPNNPTRGANAGGTGATSGGGY
jgi:hypothetical protein